MSLPLRYNIYEGGDLGDKVFYIVTDNVFDKINQNNAKDILGKIKEHMFAICHALLYN